MSRMEASNGVCIQRPIPEHAITCIMYLHGSNVIIIIVSNLFNVQFPGHMILALLVMNAGGILRVGSTDALVLQAIVNRDNAQSQTHRRWSGLHAYCVVT